MAGSNTNPLTYPLSRVQWQDDIFSHPPSEYRGAPFWSWNTKLRHDQLMRQIESFQQMGMGGFHIHSRTGLDTPYMGEEFLAHVKACAEVARERGLLACLYDEDRWPSGVAGGLVVADEPDYKALHLLLTKRPYGSFVLPKPIQGANGKATRSELGHLVARYRIQFNEAGINSAKRLADDEENDEENDEDTWFAYVEPNPPSEWFNSQTYVDTLNGRAIQKFIKLTHERYYQHLAADFGKTVPSIFTDEPQFAHKSQLRKSTDCSDLLIPWSKDLPETFRKQYGYDVLDELPSIFWDIPASHLTTEEPHLQARYHFHDHVCERFVTAFMDTIAGWCRGKNIALIGHMMKEPTLLSQTQALGEAMRCYRNLDMPGVDMLCDQLEHNTVKQATSVARQNGARGVMSELYGVTGWTFTFAGHKGAGDWQAALGVTFRVHHLAWVSMTGESKRDYPACIGYQSPWHKEYKCIEDHFARVNVAMTRGSPRTRVAVIHPIESFWLCYGPMDLNASETKFREQAFESLTNWLSFGTVDFEFISESLLPSQTPLESIQPTSPFPVGKCRYEAIILPNLKTIRSSTLERLERFAKGGGRVLIAGVHPSLLDGTEPLDINSIASAFSYVPWTEHHLLSALEPHRDVKVLLKDDGSAAQTMLYQLREDHDEMFLFICNTHRKRYFPTEVGIRGLWNTVVLDTMTGDKWNVKSTCLTGWTWVDWHFEACGSLLLSLKPRSNDTALVQPKPTGQSVYREDWVTTSLVELRGVELSEPNVLLLDYASFSLDNGHTWEDITEVYRIDNIVRERFSLPLKGEAYRQPWTIPASSRVPKTTIKLRYEIRCETTIPSSKLALEHQPDSEITLDGRCISTERRGYWVDEDISLFDIPYELTPGVHILEASVPFGLLTNLERMYLLGDFAVEVRGRICTLRSLDLTRIDFGNWAIQGLPFYAGNVTYICRFKSSSNEKTIIHVPHFAAPVLAVFLDGVRVGVIAVQPYVIELGTLPPGSEHELRIIAYGNRENAFGTLHMPDGVSRWFAPNAWRTEHDWWIEGYNVKAAGILDNPRIKNPGEEKWKVPRNPERLWTCC